MSEEEESMPIPLRKQVSRKFASLMIKNNHLLYLQWFPGQDNIIADCLFQDWHYNDAEFIQLLTSILPKQIHPKFSIAPIPKEIDSFLCSILLQLPKRTQQSIQPKTSGFVLGESGENSCPQWALDAMNIWKLLSAWQRHIMLLAFVQAVRNAEYSLGRIKRLVATTVNDTIAYISQTFRLAQKQDHRLDKDKKTCILIQQTICGYKNQDPGVKQMKAIPVMLIRMIWKLAKLTNAPLGIAIAQLVTLAFFFAMRSCEYSKMSSEESKRTEIICLRNIRFYRNNRLVPHTSPNLHNADMVNITFEFQKNDERNESVGMFAAGADNDMCPVKVTTAIVRRVRGYTDIGADINDRKVNLFKNDKGKMTEITSMTIRKKLRRAATSKQPVLGKQDWVSKPWRLVLTPFAQEPRWPSS